MFKFGLLKNLLLLIFLTSFSIYAQVHTLEVPATAESQIIEASKQEIIGNPDQAIMILEKLRSNQEAKSTVYYMLARLYLSKSRLEDALNAINESVNADPSNKWTRVYQANVYESVGRYINTAEAYEALTKIEPENYTMYDLAALNYIKADKTENALAILDRAQMKFGLLPKLSIKKSRILLIQKKEKKAIELLQLSLSEYPKNEELYAEIYPLLLGQNNSVEAERILKQLKVINKNHPLIRSIESRPSLDNNLNDIKTSIDRSDSNIDQIIQSLIPFIQKMDTSNLTLLLTISDKLITRFTNDPKSWSVKGDLLYNSEEYYGAIQAYKKATELAPVPYSVWENLILSQIKMNHWYSIIEKVNIALDYYPNQGFLFYALSLAQLKTLDLTQALIQANQFALMSKNSSIRTQEANILIAQILDDQGKIEDAEMVWKKCLSATKNDLAVIEYCYSKSKLGQSILKDKLEKASQSKELETSYLSSRLAFISFFQKDYINSKKYITETLQLKAGQNPENYELASNILLAISDKENSKIMLQKAMELSDNKNYYLNLLNKLN